MNINPRAWGKRATHHVEFGSSINPVPGVNTVDNLRPIGLIHVFPAWGKPMESVQIGQMSHLTNFSNMCYIY